MAYNVSTDNTDMLKELISGECMEWEPRDRKAWLQFGKMLSRNLNFNLGTEQSSKLFDSIAFCNYLQIPDIALDNRQGKDEECLYVYSENIFKEYLEEAKPDKIIVWGEPIDGRFIHRVQFILQALKREGFIMRHHCPQQQDPQCRGLHIMLLQPCYVFTLVFHCSCLTLKSIHQLIAGVLTATTGRQRFAGNGEHQGVAIAVTIGLRAVGIGTGKQAETYQVVATPSLPC